MSVPWVVDAVLHVPMAKDGATEMNGRANVFYFAYVYISPATEGFLFILSAQMSVYVRGSRANQRWRQLVVTG